VIDLTDGIEDAPFGVEPGERDQPMVWSVSLNRRAHATIWRSRATVKADAAVRVFEITCRDLAWAVIDSGINARHVAFRARKSTGVRYDDPFEDGKNRTRVLASYDFSVVRDLLSEDTLEATAARLPAAKDDAVKMLHERVRAGLDVDWDLVGRIVQIPHVTGVYREPTQEHGTHVAGILAGDCRQDSQLEAPTDVRSPRAVRQVRVRPDHPGAACLGDDPADLVAAADAAPEIPRQTPQFLAIALLIAGSFSWGQFGLFSGKM